MRSAAVNTRPELQGSADTASPETVVTRSKATCFRPDDQGAFDGRSPSTAEKDSPVVWNVTVATPVQIVCRRRKEGCK